MKLLSIFLLSTLVLIVSCAQESDESTSNSQNSSSTSTPSAPENNTQAPVFDPNANQPATNQAPQPVPPTLPNNVRQAAQQNAIQQQQQQQFQLQQQQQQQQAAQSAPVKTIGDERTAHFICPNACKGSGADAVANCPTCGTQYTHNADSPWHEANNQATPTATPAQPAQTATPAITAPAVNTDPLPTGDHNTSHYVCPDRCVGGGSGGPGKCPVCSKDYVHNAESPAHMEEVRRREQQQP